MASSLGDNFLAMHIFRISLTMYFILAHLKHITLQHLALWKEFYKTISKPGKM